MYTEAQWKKLGNSFNSKSFLGKLILIKSNPTIMYIESDGYNVRLRLFSEEAMINNFDSYFSFPEFFEYSHLKDVFSLNDISIKELK